jgi:hypothetical protein
MTVQSRHLQEGLPERVLTLIELDRALLRIGAPGLLERPPQEAASLAAHIRNAAQRRTSEQHVPRTSERPIQRGHLRLVVVASTR